MAKLFWVRSMNLEKLFFLREEFDLTQEDMAKIIGVSRVAISQWETTKEIIPLDKLNKYANYFNVSMDYILGISKVKNYNVENTELNREIITNRIAEVRKNNALSQSALAKVLNTTHSTISSYESGKTLILTTFAYQICIKYKVSMDWLCGRIQ